MGSKEIIECLAARKSQLEVYGVSSLAVFGSFARGDEQTNSDIDLLVEFSKANGIFEFIRLKTYLEEILGRPVDLVTPDALKPQLKERILRESIRV
jgi:predicted nucleotidyltransferase